MSAMDLDAPVSIAPQFREQQTGATSAYILPTLLISANKLTVFFAATVALQSTELHQPVLYAMIASNSQSTYLKESSAKPPSTSAETAIVGSSHPPVGLSRLPSRENCLRSA